MTLTVLSIVSAERRLDLLADLCGGAIALLILTV